jgi:hypothetical protein
MSFTPRFICGDGNFPRRQVLTREHLQLLVDLQNKKSTQRFKATGDLSSELLEEGLLAIDAEGSIHSNAMVIQIADGAKLYALSKLYSQGIRQILKINMAAIEEKTCAIVEFLGQPFLKNSFLILSNVILDNWQIQNIERFYLEQERPLRGGKRFYFSVMESSLDERDPFGIYGNVSQNVGSDFYCFYGNSQRALRPVDFTELAHKNEVQTLSQNSNAALSKIALIVCNDLIRFFKGIDKELRDYHATSSWAHLTYAEFFIWWYHFLYTQVTNDLARSGDLIIPKSGMSPYIIKGE